MSETETKTASTVELTIAAEQWPVEIAVIGDDEFRFDEATPVAAATAKKLLAMRDADGKPYVQKYEAPAETS